MRVWLALLPLVLVACTFDKSGVPFADSSGAVDVDPLPDGAMCSATGFPKCDDQNLQNVQTCVNNTVQTSACASLVCAGSPGSAACEVVDPSNGVILDTLVGATANIVIASGETWVFETDTGTITRCDNQTVPGGIVYRELAGEKLGIFAFQKLDIMSGGVLRVVPGPAGNGLVLLSETTVRIEGELSLPGGERSCSVATACGDPSGSRQCEAAGGFGGGAANSAGAGPGGGGAVVGGTGSALEVGGGGAGHAAMGGRGGDSNNTSGGAAGTAYGNTRLEPLAGGSGGGGGGEQGGTGGPGGGGGGAVQIVALHNITVIDGGRILAVGAGGGAGLVANAGGGAGSGGAILLESPSIILTGGFLSANGGGGGGGDGGGGTTTGPGCDGNVGAVRACRGPGTHPGGLGGSSLSPSGSDGLSSNPTDGTGGGGGAAGRILLRSQSTAAIVLTGSSISPNAATSNGIFVP